MTRQRLALVFLLSLLGLCTGAASAQAACTTWKGGSGNWSEASKWSPETVPGSEADACITSGTVEITGNGANVKSLTVGSGATVNVRGTSWVYQGETQRVTPLSAGSGSFAAGSHLSLEATNGGTTQGGSEAKGANAFLTGGPIAVGGQIETKVGDPEFDDRVKVAGLKIEPSGGVSVASGKLQFLQEGEGAYPWAVINEGSFSVAAGATMEMQPSFAGSAAFTNAGSVVNGGSVQGNGIQWAQTAGSVSGNPIVLDGGSTLTDSGGAGSFLGAYSEITVTGTIPAGQSVTVRGEPYSYGGELYNSTTLSTGGKELVNDGTLILNPTGEGSTGGQVNVESGSIRNNGVIDVTTETPGRLTQLLEPLTNGPSGRLEINGGIFQGNGPPLTNEGVVTLAPGAVLQLQEGGSFLNKGTFSPQISGSSYGIVKLNSPCCNGPGVFTAGGTLAPLLLGGYLPTPGLDLHIFALEGGKFEGTFPSVGNGFAADYAHESSEPAFVGVYRGTGGGTAPAPAPTAHVVSIAGGHGKLTLVITCPSGGASCTTATLTVSVVEHLKGSRLTAVSAGAKATTRTVAVAGGRIALAAGAHKTLSFSLNAKGLALLKHFGELSALAKVTSGSTVLRHATVHILKPAKRKAKK